MLRSMTGAAQMTGIFVTIVIVAALVNRFRPAHRPQIRRLVILFMLLVICHGAHFALKQAGEHRWADGFALAADLVLAFTVVNIAATFVFSVALPLTGV